MFIQPKKVEAINPGQLSSCFRDTHQIGGQVWNHLRVSRNARIRWTVAHERWAYTTFWGLLDGAYIRGGAENWKWNKLLIETGCNHLHNLAGFLRWSDSTYRTYCLLLAVCKNLYSFRYHWVLYPCLNFLSLSFYFQCD